MRCPWTCGKPTSTGGAASKPTEDNSQEYLHPQDSTVMLQQTPPARISKTTSTGPDYHGQRQHGGLENILAAAAATAAASTAASAAGAGSETEAKAHAVLEGGGVGGVGADASSSNSEDLFSLGSGNSSSGGGGGEGGPLSVSVAAVERCEDCGRTFAPGRLRSHAKARGSE